MHKTTLHRHIIFTTQHTMILNNMAADKDEETNVSSHHAYKKEERAMMSPFCKDFYNETVFGEDFIPFEHLSMKATQTSDMLK